MRVLAVVCLLLAFAAPAAAEKRKKQTAAVDVAKKAKPRRDRSIGAPWDGRLQAAAKLAPGDRYHVRRPHRAYATKTTIQIVRQAVKDTLADYPKAHTLAIGDFSAEAGGWISEHASHQSGRDVDLGLFFKKKPKGYPATFVKATKDTLDAAATWRLVSLLARTQDEDGGVQMIFLDQKLQNALIAWAQKHKISASRIAEVRRVFRHIALHADHMHVRFKCRARDSNCR